MLKLKSLRIARQSGRCFSSTSSNLSYIAGNKQPLSDMHTSQLLRHQASAIPNNLALISAHQNDLRWTYQELDQRVDNCAAALIELGMQKGERVGIYSPNNAEWTLLQLACARANLILVNVNPAFQASELKYCLQKVGIKTLVTSESFKASNYIEIINNAVPELQSQQGTTISSSELPDLKHIVALTEKNFRGMLTWGDLQNLSGRLDEMKARESLITSHDDTNIQFTSGTTGYPKGVTLTHHNILNNGLQIGERMKIQKGDRICIPVPLYHCFGCVLGNMVALNYGATMVYPSESFEPRASLEAVSKEKCQALYGVPTMFIAMLEELKKMENVDTENLRTGIVAGSLCPKPLMERIIDELGLDEMTNCYGQTETGPVSFQSFTDTPFDAKVSSVGLVHPNVEAKVVDEQGEIVPHGVQGELAVRGYLVMSKYWNDPEKTAEVIDDEKWCYSGDLAIIDEEGYCKITGRVRDMIIRGGENIYPIEIEEFFIKHESINDVQIIGIDDELLGQEVCAWITLKEGCSLTVDELREYAKGQIAHYKIPKYVSFVEAYPATVTGKVKKNVMREQSLDMLQKGDPSLQLMGHKKVMESL